jgi:recombination protein RecT
MTDQNTIVKIDSVKELVTDEFFRTQISEALPGQISTKRYMRCLYTMVQKNPKLLTCTPDSVRASAIACAQMGVEPNGRDAHLIPYGRECTLIIDYKGLIRLALQSGKVSYLHADVVCENDEFEFDKGEILHHKVNFRVERGKVYAVYALAKFKDGTEKAEVMHLDEVNAIRDRSKAKNSGPWVTDYSEMCKKTALRRLSKWLELSPEIHERIAAEDEMQFDNAKTVSEISKPAFMEQAVPVEDDIPMDDAPEPQPVEIIEEDTKPAPKKKAAKKKSATTEPMHIKKIRVLCEADGVNPAQLEKYCSARGLDPTKKEDCDRIAEFWSNLVDDLKLIEV